MRCMMMIVESTRTFYLKIAMLIALIGLGLFYGICVDARESENLDVRIEAAPHEPAANVPVTLYAAGVVPSWAYSVSNGTAEVRGNEIFVDLPIIALMIYIEDPEPVEVYEPIARFMLDEGEYTVRATISGEEQPPFTFTVGPPIEVDNEIVTQFDVENLDIRIEAAPHEPAANLPVALYAAGVVPSWAYSVSNGVAELRGNEIHVDLPIIALDIYLEDPEPVEVYEPIARFMLDEGEYTVRATISGVEQEPFTFTVGPPVKTEESDPLPPFDDENLDVRIEVAPEEPVANQPVDIIAAGVVPSWAYSVSNGTAEVRGNEIHVNLPIIALMIYIFDPEPVEVYETIARFMLEEGEYTVYATISGEEQEPFPFKVGPPADLDFETTPPLINAGVEALPQYPNPGDDISLKVTGFLPDTSWSITHASFDIQDENIHITMQVESEGIGLDVLTPMEEQFRIGPLEAGVYVVTLEVNGLAAAKVRLQVIDRSIPEEFPRPWPDPNQPVSNIHNARIIAEPNPAEPGEPIRFTLVGEFSTPGYRIELLEPLMVKGEMISAVVNVIDPTEEILLPVTDPFRFELGELILAEGMYYVNVSTPELLIAVGRVLVGDPPMPIPVPPRPHLPYNARVLADPNPADPGEPVRFTLMGEFPTPGYHIELVEPLSVSDHIITAVVDIVAPTDEFLPTVIDPFEFELGELSLEAGTYAITVSSVAPEMIIAYGRLQVGEAPERSGEFPMPILMFDREGGFAGTHSWLLVSMNGEIIRLDAFGGSPDAESGVIPEDRWLSIRDSIDRIGFDQLPEHFAPVITVSDGFIYTIEYEGKRVVVEEGAEVPSELQALIDLLVGLLGEPFDDYEATNVGEWLLH